MRRGEVVKVGEKEDVGAKWQKRRRENRANEGMRSMEKDGMGCSTVRVNGDSESRRSKGGEVR